MSKKTVLILLGLVLVLGLGVFLKNREKEDSASKDGENIVAIGELLFENLALKEIAKITITNDEGTITVTKAGDNWVVPEKQGWGVNFKKFNTLLHELKETRVTRVLKAGPKLDTRFHLNIENNTNEGTGYLVKLLKEDGSVIESFQVGKGEAKKDEYGTVVKAGRYLRLGSQKDVVYMVNEDLEDVVTTPGVWLANELPKLAKVKSISFEAPNEKEIKKWNAERKDEKANFLIGDLAEDEELNTSSLAQLKGLLINALFVDLFTSKEAEALRDSEKERKVKINTFDGFEYNLTITPLKSAENETPERKENLLFSMEVTANLQEKRTPKEGESKEEAKKAEEEFAKNLAGLKEKLKKEKAFEGKVYEVNKYTLMSVNKGRKEMVRSKTTGGTSTNAKGQVEAVTPPVAIPPMRAPQAPPVQNP